MTNILLWTSPVPNFIQLERKTYKTGAKFQEFL